MPSLTRRQLFQSAAAAGVAVAAVRPLGAIDPIPRAGLGRIHLSLAGYSFRKWLNLAKKPRPEMTSTTSSTSPPPCRWTPSN